MKKSLFLSEGSFYKANLHNHTTVSDGHHTPEEIKKIYQSQGYSIIAYSDHDIMVPHPELTDEDFLALTAMEYEFNEDLGDVPYDFIKTYHLVLIAPEEDCRVYPWPNPDYANRNARNYIQDYYKGNCPRDYDVNCVNAMIEDAHKHGFLVTYCHPHWSTQLFPDYCGIEGADFVETFNTGCYVVGWNMDADDHVYHDFLSLKKHCFPTASDDGHNTRDYCGAATYVKADSLSYEDVIDSLRTGDVYASWGPIINDIYFDKETSELTVDCPNAAEVFLVTERRYADRFRFENGVPVNKAIFNLKNYVDQTLKYGKKEDSFVRIVVVDGAGKRALSRGYFLDELLS